MHISLLEKIILATMAFLGREFPEVKNEGHYVKRCKKNQL